MSTPSSSSGSTPARGRGLLVLHGNRLEDLAQVVFDYLQRHPLPPLSEEVFLVQSNGMAEWVKMELAAAHGICAAVQVMLPARFIWRAYRAVLGRQAVPAASALDKLPLTWRLMALLPRLAPQTVFAPLRPLLTADPADGTATDPWRRLQLARRLADLFDQYQVYRPDWLQDWAAGHDRLRPRADAPPHAAAAVPAAQRWQPALWRTLLAELPAVARDALRPALQQRFLQALAADARSGAPAAPAQGDLFDVPPRPAPALPPRIVLFGTTHIPHATLEALAAIAAGVPEVEVILAVPNPCRYHWADIVEGRELLRAAARRHALRGGVDLAALPLHQLHAHGHPLLAAWGRQARDFVRQLDAFDDVQRARRHFGIERVDLFDAEGSERGDPGASSASSASGSSGSSGPAGAAGAPAEVPLLRQVQQRIRDLVPLAEHPRVALRPGDRSIVFHVAHSALREVEILHDQLLHLLAEGQGALAPRDIVVMVPDIDTFAPAVRAIFGQVPRQHARHIPWGIADQRERAHAPLLAVLEALLRAPQLRFTASELHDWLQVGAVAARAGVRDDQLPTLQAWIEGAGIRWGLDATQREALDLATCGDTNTWHFGLQRMLLGYANGDAAAATGTGPGLGQGAVDRDGGAFHGIEPFAEVAGLEAALAGALALWVQALRRWWADAAAARSASAWAERLRLLLAEFFLATDDEERALLGALNQALTDWLAACDEAEFGDEPLPLSVVREAWLDALDEPQLNRRFRAGGVTFCTLLPLRAIPFEVVCLLGMNDGDYPRRGTRADFDLMAEPGQARAGDRSRRDDDRQLMLDALLAARRVLYLSWRGRSVRDNQPQPPSVLVAQLRDYLDAGWGAGTSKTRTTEHPLQPFSRRYFSDKTGDQADDKDKENDQGLFTYATEWRAAFDGSVVEPAPAAAPMDAMAEGPAPSFTLNDLEQWLRNPVKAWFRHRLQVVFDEIDPALADDEVFATAGLENWQLVDEVLRAVEREEAGAGPVSAGAPADPRAKAQAQVARALARQQRAGRLPLAGPGAREQARLARTLVPMLLHWHALRQRHPQELPAQPLHFSAEAAASAGIAPTLDDGGFVSWQGAEGALWTELQASKLLLKKGSKSPRPDKLIKAWLRTLAAAACGAPAPGIVIGSDVVVHVSAPPPAQAAAQLARLLGDAALALRGPEPWPTAVRTGVAWLEGEADPSGAPRPAKPATSRGGPSSPANPDLFKKPGRGPALARAVFDGSDGSPVAGEGREPCLARCFEDFEALQAHPQFRRVSERLYEPYRIWLSEQVQVHPLPDAVDLEADDEAAEPGEAEADAEASGAADAAPEGAA